MVAPPEPISSTTSRGPAAILRDRFDAVRARTVELTDSLEPEDFVVQSMTDASPAKWHLAHTTWFFETFVLDRFANDHTWFDEHYRVLFNSYYNGIGEQHPRPERGLLSRPGVREVLEYRRTVDARVRDLLGSISGAAADEVGRIVEIGLHHEEQHEELLVTDLKHMFSRNPMRPAYRRDEAPSRRSSPELGWRRVPGGTFAIGHEGATFCFDNETPRHRVLLEPFELGTRLVTNREYLEFVRAGGYDNPGLWLDAGWVRRTEQGWRHPIYWERRAGDWLEFTVRGMLPLDLDAPAVHLSYFEADAFARFAGARLPTEAEWEAACSTSPVRGNFLDAGVLHPQAPVGGRDGELLQTYGDAWEWTSSAYSGYPGYRPLPGALGEYNGKFMCGQFVLRGGSCATPPGHVRPTYRNFFLPAARWQYSGIRLARDAT